MSERKEACRPRFFIEPVHNKAKSEIEGRPIYEDREMVELRQPGQRDTYVGLAHEPIDNPNGGPKIPPTERFPEHYAAFKRGEERATVGTPLDFWPPLTKSRVAELKVSGILTVEELSSVPDNTLPKLGMGAREEREKARAWLDAAKQGAGQSAMAAELAELKALVAQLTAAKADAPEPRSKSLEDCTDAEIKEFIRRETGEPVRGNPSRQTLMDRAAELAKAVA